MSERIKPVEKLIKESDNDVEIAEKIRDLGMAKQMQWNNNNNNENQGSKAWEECLIFFSLETDPIFKPYLFLVFSTIYLFVSFWFFFFLKVIMSKGYREYIF